MKKETGKKGNISSNIVYNGSHKVGKLKKVKFFDIVIVAILTLWALLVFYPFYNAFLVSVVPQHIYTKTPFMLYPPMLDFSSYKFVFSSDTLLNGFKITTFILVFGVAYNMFLTVTTAYALTKPIPGRKILTYYILFTMYFSGGLIPFYLLMQQLGLVDNIFVMILPTGISITYMLIIKSFFEDIPKELEEAAKIDGANDIYAFIRIILPLSLPVLATFALYYGVERWNEWWFGMLFIKSTEFLPLQTILRNVVQDVNSIMGSDIATTREQVFSDGVKMATIIISMLPIMCLYPFMQKYFVTGLTLGGVKS